MNSFRAPFRVVCSALARGVCLHGRVNLSITSIRRAGSASPSPGLLLPRLLAGLLHIPSRLLHIPGEILIKEGCSEDQLELFAHLLEW